MSGVPAVLHGHSEAIVLYRNLPSGPGKNAEEQEQRAALALRLDQAMREKAPAGWNGDPAREAQVLNALFPLLDRSREATLALFELVKNQRGY